MNALKPDRNILVGASFIGIWSAAILVYLISKTQMGLAEWALAIVPSVITYVAIRDLHSCWLQYMRYRAHREEFDEHIRLRNEIVIALNRLKPHLREIYTACYTDDNGLDFSGVEGSPPFYCILTTTEDEHYDALSGESREIEMVRGYYIPRNDCYAVQVEYDAVSVISSEEVWFRDWSDQTWRSAPESQASNEELRELLGHLQAV